MVSSLCDFHVAIGKDIEDDLRSLVDCCEDFWKEITKEELPSPTYSNHVTWDWNDVDRLLELEVDYDASADDTVVGDDNTPPDDAAKVDKNRKRRLNEAERLQKYSWDRVERPDEIPAIL